MPSRRFIHALLVSWLVLMVGIAIAISFLQIANNPKRAQFNDLQKEWLAELHLASDSLSTRQKNPDHSDDVGNNVDQLFGPAREISAVLPSLKESVVAIEHMTYWGFGIQAVLVLPFIALVYSVTDSKELGTTTIRNVALLAVPFALLYGLTGCEAFTNPNRLIQFIFLLTYPTICLISLWLLRRQWAKHQDMSFQGRTILFVLCALDLFFLLLQVVPRTSTLSIALQLTLCLLIGTGMIACTFIIGRSIARCYRLPMRQTVCEESEPRISRGRK